MNTMFDLTGKNALVVGGAGDLGYSMLEALVEAGARCVVVDICSKLDTVVSGLKDKGYDVIGIKADISQRSEIRSSFAATLKHFDNKLDILVNAAGITKRHPAEEFPEDEFDLVMAINFMAPWLYTQLAANSMIPNGGGKIITIASLQSIIGGINNSAYTASKGAISQINKTLCNEWAKKGININSIAPGYMATQLNTALLADEKRSAEILSRIPQGRWGTGNDLKGVTVFLASEASNYVNGILIPVDGGWLCR